MITFSCSNCDKSFNVADEAAGKKAKCPDCGEQLRVPSTADVLASWRDANPPPPVPKPLATKEPWCYTFLEQAADIVWTWSGLLCIIGFLVSTCVSFAAKEPLAIFLLVTCSVISWAVTYFSILVGAAVVKVLVDGGRSLRVMRGKIEQEKS